jgi:hypothetical protein
LRSPVLSYPTKPQVLIPDVQKLVNQLGAVNTDLFASRHVRPPTSVLLLPLRASGAGIYGALYCLSDVQARAFGVLVPGFQNRPCGPPNHPFALPQPIASPASRTRP